MFAELAPASNGTAIWGTGRDNVYLMVLAGAVYRSHQMGGQRFFARGIVCAISNHSL
jgi:hypothetical protein